jgi:putative nucleotidyltransferase with HDIG domain
MSLEPDLAEQELLADSFSLATADLSARERRVALGAAAALLGVSAAMWILAPPRDIDALPLVLCMLVLAVSTRVRFDTPLGFTVPTQLAFVPFLFATPAALVPAGCVCALMIGEIPDLLRRETPVDRLLLAPGNAWFAVGPSAVFIAAGTTASQAGPALLLLALAAQFAGDFCISTLRCAIVRGMSVRAQLQETWVYGVDAGLSAIALVVARATLETPAAVLSLLPLLGLLEMFARERHRRLEGLLELNSAYRGTALVLGDVVEADDGYTAQHCKSVVALALEVATHLELSPEQARNLEFGALLHDVGKIAIPKEIVNNPGALSEGEWAIIKTHTLEGQRMLDRVGGFMHDVGLIIRSHHERWDGKGYPDAIAGEAIPFEARIITCCDSWNAMRTDRVYRRALSHERAVAEMEANIGTQFDPRVAQTLLAVVAAERSSAPQGASKAARGPDDAEARLAPCGRGRRRPRRGPPALSRAEAGGPSAGSVGRDRSRGRREDVELGLGRCRQALEVAHSGQREHAEREQHSEGSGRVERG